MSKNQYDKFGVEKEEYEKSKDILPTFSMKDLEFGSSAFMQFLEKEPREIDTRDINDETKTVKTKVITAYIEKIERKTEDAEILEIPVAEKQTVFLSSKTFRLGLLKVFEENESNLEGVKIKVTKSKATYKQGENTCYNVTSLS